MAPPRDPALPFRGALKGIRVVALLQMPEENRGLFYKVGLQVIDALRACGAEVFPFDASYAYQGNLTRLFPQVGKLHDFKPDLVISNGALQALHCRTGQVVMGDGRYVPNNLFVDNMRLPTLLVWDGIAEAFATLGQPGLDPKTSRAGVRAALSDQINNPLYYHCLLDREHLEVLRRLDVLTSPNVKVRLAGAYPQNVSYGLQPPEPGFDEDVAFTGNLFLPRPPRGEGDAQAIIARFLERTMQLIESDICGSYWAAVERALGELDDADRRTAALDMDQSFFWEFVAADVLSTAIARTRLSALRASKRPVSLYGLMFDPASAVMLADQPHLRYKAAKDPIDELPRLNRRTKVTLDVVTNHFPTGITAKIAGCFAAGGLCLFNYKAAFRETFGPDAERVMYRDFDDMNAKLDHLLTHERERAELAAHFQAEVREKATFVGLLAELIPWVKETAAAAAS